MDVGAYREGHFLLTSGRHGDRFFLMPLAFQRPPLAEAVGRAVAALFAAERVDAVVGPATGGIILAHEVARALGARSMFAEKDGDAMVLRRGFRLEAGERVLVVEDVVTTGGSVMKTIAALEPFSPVVVGIGAVIDRSGGRAVFGVPFRTVASVEARDWAPEECPLCREGVPLVRPKHDKQDRT
ncbi:MAG: orotate phosphoribosyltransferase [Firmicutes bacterium]|nr:orotate phosphoribosyltransferase [Bacillota bacterium]